jgi:hypothetical protein
MPYQTSDYVGNGQTSLYGFASALPSPVNYFANTNANGFTLQMPYQASDFVGNGQTSLYGFAAALPSPVNYFANTNANGFTLQMPYQVSDYVGNGQTSLYGFAGALPSPVDFIFNFYANGFTLQAPYQVTQFLDPGNQSIYGFAGALPAPVNYFANTNANGFTLQMPYQVTDFVGNGQTSLYGFAGALPAPIDFFNNDHQPGFTLQPVYQQTNFVGNGQTSIYGFPGALPTPVDYFNLGSTNASGFTLNAPYQVTQFTANGQTSLYGFASTYPTPVDFFFNENRVGFKLQQPYQVSFYVANGQTSRYGFASTLPRPVNYFRNINANGFTLNAPYQVTQFVGNGQTSRYGFAATLPTPVNYFINPTSGASGFTLKQAALQTQFLGASGGSYAYPSSVAGGRLMNVGQGPWVGGIAKLENQLGAGSPKFGNKGWYVSNKYAPTGTWSSLNAPGNLKVFSTTRRSPSPLDTAYSYSSYYGHDLKLRSTSYNPSYLNHPLILRGIQNGTEPQRWGTGTPYDLGGIRGGAVTAAERIAVDAVRIGKILASPQGLLWSVLQLGLGKSNPISEDPAARLRIGPTVLASVVTNAFGGHIKSIDIGSPGYGKIAEVKNLATPAGPAGGENRLVLLATGIESFNPQIPFISGPGGPNSTYGIGFTNITRVVNTRNFSLDPISNDIKLRVGWPENFSGNYYARIPSATTSHKGNKIKADLANRTPTTVDGTGIQTLATPGVFTPGENTINPTWTPGSNGVVTPGKATPQRVENEPKPGPKSPSGNIFATIPYNELRGLAKGRGVHTTVNNNFLNQVEGTNVGFYTTAPVDYVGNSMDLLYGMGTPGKPGRDRTNPYVDLVTDGSGGTKYGDKVNALNYQKNTRAGAYSSVKDFIYFYFAGPDAPGSDEIIPFRATVSNISDNFSPSWNPVTVMGRPDSPAIYSTFQRSVSFDFMVAATSREELVPMWRKLNYLATCTMPLYSGGGRPQGPITRLTIGDMYSDMPGYISSLTIGVNEEATWDISSEGNGKQLPTIVDVSVTFDVIHDYRPQKGGRAYSIYSGPGGNWLHEAVPQ